MSFGNSFVQGLNRGQDLYLKFEELDRQKARDAREVETHKAQLEEFGWKRDAQKRENEAYAALDGAQNGVSSDDQTQTPGGLQRNSGAGEAGGTPTVTPTATATPNPTAAPVKPAKLSELDMERGLERVAIAKRDVTGIRASRANQKELGRIADQREFMTRLQTLANDPEKSGEFQAEIAPALKAFSEFQGIPANFHYDPKTRQIVSTPYGQKDPKTGQVVYGAPSSIPLETAMPYLLAQRSLVKEYGDPEKAAAAMAKMTDDERNKRINDATRSFTQATGLSTADTQQRDSMERGRHNRAIEGIYAGREARRGDEVGRLVTLEDSASGEPVLFDPKKVKYDEDGRAVLPQGLRLPRKQTEPKPFNKEHAAALLQLGAPRGAPGTKDRQQWNDEKAYIDSIYGAAPPRSKLDDAIDAHIKNTLPPATGLRNMSTAELNRLAGKPKGVSTEEANEARQQLNLRRTNAEEPQMKAF